MIARRINHGRPALPLLGVLLAMLSCYGPTILLAILSGFGIAVPLNGTVWAVAIVAFAALGVFGMTRRRRVNGAPLIMAIIGLGLLGWVMFGAYSRGGEVLAFALLLAAAIWDYRTRRTLRSAVTSHRSCRNDPLVSTWRTGTVALRMAGTRLGRRHPRMSARTGNRAGRVLAVAGSFAVLGAFTALAIAERAQPLRARGAPDTPRRLIRNLVLAGISAAAVQVAERPILIPLTNVVERRRWGLLPRLGLPTWAETTASVLLMDYTLYLWHVMTHRVPLLWRFHRVHHADLDLDASTAIRFHFGEFVLGVPYRALQVALIGVGPRA